MGNDNTIDGDSIHPCEHCGDAFNGEKSMVACDSCNVWYHVACAGLKKTPTETEDFFCGRCKNDTLRAKKTLTRTHPRKSLEPKSKQQSAVNSSMEKRIQQLETKLAEQQQKTSALLKEFTLERTEREKLIKKQQETIASLTKQIAERTECGSHLQAHNSAVDIGETMTNQNLNETVRNLVHKYLEEKSMEDDSASNASGGSRHGNSESFAIKQTLTELPKFSGNPRDWPAFISAYRGSNQQARFYDYENMARLSKCLSGDALMAVEGYLMHPQLVDKAIEELENLYGNPNLVKRCLEQEILNSEKPSESDPNSIVRYAIKVRNHVCYLKTLTDCESQLKNQDTINRFLGRLSSGLQVRWYEVKNVLGTEPTLENFDNWLSAVAKNYRSVSINNGGVVLNATSTYKKRTHSVNMHSRLSNENDPFEIDDIKRGHCYYCRESSHYLTDCTEFAEASRVRKFQFLRKNNLCYTCFNRNHSWKRCNKNRDVNEPQMHPLLKTEDEAVHTESAPADSMKVMSHHIVRSRKTNLFRVIPVNIHAGDKKIRTCALLDDCSDVTLIDAELADNLKLPITEKNVPVTLEWTQGKISNFSANKVIVHLSGCKDMSKIYRLRNVHTVNRLNLPQQSVDAERLKKNYPYLSEIEIENIKKVTPLILIGVEHTKLGTPIRVIEGNFNQPVAYKTRLGWTVHGPEIYNQESETRHTLLICCCNQRDDALHDLVRHHFTTESFGVKPPGLPLESKENARAVQLLERRVTYVGERYEAPLLWKNDDVKLPKSKEMALKRLENLEQRLNRDEMLKNLYMGKISEYLEKGYARKLSLEELKVEREREWYLPHFPVQNVNKPGKLRIVMDAAAKVNNQSLNSFLLSGPDVYNSLISVLWSFRLFKWAVVGDIAEMFLQIQIADEDQSCQRFLWRNCDKSKEPETFQLMRMTFGATSSPFTAQWIKNENARKHKDDYPEAYHSITRCHYVDDYLESFSDEEEAVRVVTQVKEVHARAGFIIRNFTTNSKKLQEILSLQKDTMKNEISIQWLEKNSTEKVLGMYWEPDRDVFVFRVNYLEKLNIDERQVPTKRQFLRILMSIFDPHGLISNYTIYGKILLQDIWISKIGWDQRLQSSEN